MRRLWWKSCRAVMAGYSEPTLLKKLGGKDGGRVALVNQPSQVPEELQTLSTAARGEVDLAVLFVKSQAELTRDYPKQAARIAADGKLWIAWPKKASGVVTDLT